MKRIPTSFVVPNLVVEIESRKYICELEVKLNNIGLETFDAKLKLEVKVR